jgi:tetrahydromethanopterin S-methyltransferase subunit G/small nuclear ribonucleoprotein (snRNP)-like protein
MDIFLDTTSALENAVQLLRDANTRYNDISKKVEMLESFFISSQNLQGISKRLDNIEQDVENATINFQDERSLLDLITNTNSRLNQVISGEIPAELQYNTDVIESGNKGISIDKQSSTGKLKISCVNYGYSLSPAYVYDTISGINERVLNSDGPFLPSESATKAVWQRVKEFDNLVRIYTAFDESFDSNLNIYLDDTVTQWKTGQVVRVTFKNKIKNLQSNNITMWTDKENGWSQKITIPASSLLSATPYIEIVCIDSINKTFEYDILR